jgi:hypothetical protein
MADAIREHIGRLAVCGIVEMPKPIRRRVIRNMVALVSGFASVIMIGILIWAAQ